MKKFRKTISAISAVLMSVTMLGAVGYADSESIKLEAEDSIITGGSNNGDTAILYPDSDAVFTVNIPIDGFYTITAISNGEKGCVAELWVDGVFETSTALNNTNSWDSIADPRENVLAKLNLSEGEHTLKIVAKGNTSTYDYLLIEKDASFFVNAVDFIFEDGKYADNSAGLDADWNEQEYSPVEVAYVASEDAYVVASEAGEWLTYALDAKKSGEYKVSVVLATPSDINMTLTLGEEQIGGVVLGTGDYGTYVECELGTLELTADENSEIRFDMVSGAVNIKEFIFTYVEEAVETDEYSILINAETDFDKQAAHGVGWYDTTPEGYDDEWMSTDFEKYGYVDVNVGAQYENCVGEATAYVLGDEWFRYTVYAPHGGYWRLLGSIREAASDGEAANFKVSVNGKADSEVITPVYRPEYSYSADFADDLGLFYLEEGYNTIKVQFDRGYAKLDAFKLIYPKMEISKYSDDNKTVLEALKSTDSKTNGLSPDGDALTLDAPISDANYGDYVSWTFNAENAGTYSFSSYGGCDNTAKGYLMVDGTPISEEKALVGNPELWGELHITELGAVELTEGVHTITFVKGETCYRPYFLNSVIIEEPSGFKATDEIGSGRYKAKMADAEWLGNDVDPVIYAAVYDADNRFVKVVTAGAINDAISSDEFTLEDGQYVKLFMWKDTEIIPVIESVEYR